MCNGKHRDYQVLFFSFDSAPTLLSVIVSEAEAKRNGEKVKFIYTIIFFIHWCFLFSYIRDSLPFSELFYYIYNKYILGIHKTFIPESEGRLDNKGKSIFKTQRFWKIKNKIIVLSVFFFIKYKSLCFEILK